MPCWFPLAGLFPDAIRAADCRVGPKPNIQELVMLTVPRKAGSAHAERSCNGVHRLGKLDVPLRHAAGVMGRELDLYRLVNVAPFGVVVDLFGHQSGPRHEAEGLVEILENEGPGDGVLAANLGPAGERRERRFPLLRRQTLRHPILPRSAGLYPDTRVPGNHDADVTCGR